MLPLSGIAPQTSLLGWPTLWYHVTSLLAYPRPFTFRSSRAPFPDRERTPREPIPFTRSLSSRAHYALRFGKNFKLQTRTETRFSLSAALRITQNTLPWGRSTLTLGPRLRAGLRATSLLLAHRQVASGLHAQKEILLTPASPLPAVALRSIISCQLFEITSKALSTRGITTLTQRRWPPKGPSRGCRCMTKAAALNTIHRISHQYYVHFSVPCCCARDAATPAYDPSALLQLPRSPRIESISWFYIDRFDFHASGSGSQMLSFVNRFG